MSFSSGLVKKTFIKIFKNLSEELSVTPSDIQLGIVFVNGTQGYEAYKNFEKVKDIDISDYVGTVIDFSGGTELIKATIGQAGSTYSKRLKCDIKDVSIVMQYKQDDFPDTVLLQDKVVEINGKGDIKEKVKIRNINISTEFFP